MNYFISYFLCIHFLFLWGNLQAQTKELEETSLINRFQNEEFTPVEFRIGCSIRSYGKGQKQLFRLRSGSGQAS